MCNPVKENMKLIQENTNKNFEKHFTLFNLFNRYKGWEPKGFYRGIAAMGKPLIISSFGFSKIFCKY